MPAERDRHPTDAFVWAWTGFVVVVIYLPIVCGVLASLGKSRYFRFPVAEFSFDWWQRTISSIEIGQLVRTSLKMAAVVTLVKVRTLSRWRGGRDRMGRRRVGPRASRARRPREV